jgi:NTP pyrophosphatase (non-canonical NTP hydrolase)
MFLIFFIAKVDNKSNSKHDADTILIHLLKELGELSTQIYNHKTGREPVNRELLESGFCDCIVMLLQLASNYDVDVDVDVEKAIQTKLIKVKQRFNI